MAKNREKLILVGLLLILFVAESVAAHRYLTSLVPGANDFYSRWAGARALLIEGRDPYGLDVTAEIQPVIGIDPNEVGRGGFAYPLHVIFLFWPLVYLPYAWTQAIWLVTLQWFAVGVVMSLLARSRWRLTPFGLVALLLATLTFYPVTRTIFLGQFTLCVALFLALSLWALSRDKDLLAGVFLAATSIKPQMVIFIGPWLVLWAIGQKRWRFVSGLLGGGGVLLLASMALFPPWPLRFLEDTQRYTDFAGGRNPIHLLLDTLWPGAPGFLFYGIAGTLLVAMLYRWVRDWKGNESQFDRSLHWAIIVGLIVPFQTGTTNQVLLLIPLFAWLQQAIRRWGSGWTIAGGASLSFGLWLLFATTITGDYENPILFLPLPYLTLAVLLTQEIKSWLYARSPEAFVPGGEE